MSGGPFTRARYQTDSLDIRPIRLQPETLQATFGTTENIQPTGGVDTQGAVSVRRGRRSYGVHARYATVVFETDPPTGYLAGSPLKIPVPLLTVWEGIIPGQAVTYLDGTNGIVISKTPELIR